MHLAHKAFQCYKRLYTIVCTYLHIVIMLFRYIYVSESSPTALAVPIEILEEARKHNLSAGITGALCLIDGSYFQYLEGEAVDIDSLSKKLRVDPRHKNFKVLAHERISERQFPEWSMATLIWNDLSKSVFRRYYPNGAFEPRTLDTVRGTSLFLAWSQTSNWITA